MERKEVREMDVKHCIETRRSIRKFEKKDVPQELLSKLVEAASYAPSWKNSQTVRYNAVYNHDRIQKIADEAVLGFEWNQKIISAAPVLMVVTTVDKRSGYERDGSFSTSKGDHWQSFDAGLSVQNFCLAAHENGLGTVILGLFDEAKVLEILDLPQEESVSALIPIGYPAEQPEMPKRKAVEDLLRIYKA